MKIEKKWIPIVSLALGMPMTFLISAISLMKLVEQEVISKNIAMIIFLAIVTQLILLIVLYAIKRKN